MSVALVALLVSLGTVTADMGGANPPYGTCLCVQGSNINVRSGPVLSHSMIGTASTGSCYTYTASKLMADGSAWYRVGYGGREGWIAGDFLNIEDADRCNRIVDGIKLKDSEARSFLTNNGIPVYSSGGCTDRNNPTCTSLEQVRSNSVNGIVRFKERSRCAVTVTGGTETGHASGTISHWNGWKLDISLTSCVDSYVFANYPYIGKRGDGAELYLDDRNNVWALEYNHWDIAFECTNCR